MTTAPSSRAEQAMLVLRCVIAILLIIHGVARAALGIVDDFGGFLTSIGLPLGVVIAWMLTLVEIVGGCLLTLGLGQRGLALWFALQLVLGIILVHAAEGWFVVGAGRNGVEYSVLLIAGLLAVAWSKPPKLVFG